MNGIWQYIYNKSLQKQCIIFCNSVAGSETTAVRLRAIASENQTEDHFHVHHGNISTTLREAAEKAMKENKPVVVIGTSSLEMGLDIAGLDRVIQVNSPVAVASFVQRMGRSGRRGQPAEIYFVCHDGIPPEKAILPAKIPWNLVQNIAVILLYLEERWIEPPKSLKYPFGILYHQTLSLLAGKGELSQNALAEQVLSLSPFRKISREDFDRIIARMLKLDHLQKLEDGGLILGMEGGRLVHSYTFYPVFKTFDTYTVLNGSEQLGVVYREFAPGEPLTLAGHTWEVISCDTEHFKVFVKPMINPIVISDEGDLAVIHTRILEKMKQVLSDRKEYPFLQDGALNRLREARLLSREKNLTGRNLIRLEKGFYCILPWMGNADYQTLMLLLRHFIPRRMHLLHLGGFEPYYILVKTREDSVEILWECLRDIADANVSLDEILKNHEVHHFKTRCESIIPKFDHFVPATLLKKALEHDFIDLPGVCRSVAEWIKQAERKS